MACLRQLAGNGQNQLLRNALRFRPYEISKVVRMIHMAASADKQTSESNLNLCSVVRLSPIPNAITSTVPTIAAQFTTLNRVGVPAGNTYAGGRSIKELHYCTSEWP